MKKRFLLSSMLFCSLIALQGAKVQAVTMRPETLEIMPAGEADVWEIPEVGLRFTTPQLYNDAKGVITYTDGTEYMSGSGVFLTEFYYVGMTGEDFLDTLYRNDLTEEEKADVRSRMLSVAYIFAIDGGRDDEDLVSFFEKFGSHIPQPEYIGESGEYSFYQCLYEPEESELEALDTFADEYRELIADTSLIGDNAEFSEPDTTPDMDPFDFETTDISGNAADSGEIFGDSQITMVNFWTTWCTYCIQEMPELAAMDEEFREKGGAVIGVLCDGNEPGAVEEAEKIMEETGVTYPVLMPWESLQQDIELQGYPTTVFVDSSGEVVAGPIVGAQVEAYRQTMEKLLG